MDKQTVGIFQATDPGYHQTSSREVGKMKYTHYNPMSSARKVLDSSNAWHVVQPGESIDIDQIFEQGGVVCTNKNTAELEDAPKRKTMKSKKQGVDEL
jgi:hypothetical protein